MDTSSLPETLIARLSELRESTATTTDTERRTSSLERVKLTREELLEYGKQCADATREIKLVESDLASIKKQLQARIDGISATIDQRSEAIRSEYEPRMVECVEVLEYPRRGRKTTFRLDTMEAVSETVMTNDELQRMLKFEEAAKEQAVRQEPPDGAAQFDGRADGAPATENTAAEAAPETAEPAAKKLPRIPRPGAGN